MTRLRLQLVQPEQRQWPIADALAALNTELRVAADADADLLLTPELFLSGYGDPAHTAAAMTADGPALQAVADLCRQHGVATVITYPEQAGPQCFNAASVIDADGQLVGHYRKRRLPNGYERALFATDTRSCRFCLHGVVCAVLICYDVEFPELVRQLAMDGVELILVPTALAARWDVVATRVLPTRAYENGIFIAYANYAATTGSELAGLSCVCAPDGQDLARLDSAAGRLSVTIDTDRIAEIRARMPLLATAAADPIDASPTGKLLQYVSPLLPPR